MTVRSVAQTCSPDYWSRACAHLSRQDRVLSGLIRQHGPARLQSHGDPFVTLARSIVGQQISVPAAQAVWDRFAALTQNMAPAPVLQLDPAHMRQAGLSARKVEYLRDLARHFDDGTVVAAQWAGMDDEAVIAQLKQIRGIGRWTAEMFLIFHLLRPDVLPLDDVGLLRAIRKNYFADAQASPAQLRDATRAWAPWRSVATWYMWRSLDPMPVAY